MNWLGDHHLAGISSHVLRGMLDSIFRQHSDKPSLLVLSDTNVFVDDKSGETLAVKHAQKFNASIFRFQNPFYAEGDHASAILIEDVDESDMADEKPAKPAFSSNDFPAASIPSLANIFIMQRSPLH